MQQAINTSLKPYFPALIFGLIAVFAFFQITFFIHPPNYDMMDCFYPWRFYVGECLQNGQFPYWNPYQDLGYPIHADPSSGAWYPMVWIIGYFNGYSIHAISLEWCFHVFCAGIGAFWLFKTLKFDPRIALIGAISYMLSGYFIGNAQHLPYIISGCWLPFVLHFYLRMMNEKSFVNTLKAAFFLFLMITGGYPAVVIILFYLLVVFFMIHVIQLYRIKNTRSIWSFLGRNALFFFTTIILSIGLLISVVQVMPAISRLGGFSIDQAQFGAFTPQAFISFVFPFATVKFTDFYQSDQSMVNGYLGLFVFLWAILGLFTKKSTPIKILWYFGIFALLAAVGQALPIREWLFRYVPMMNIFRFPSVFRLFALLGILVIGLNYIQQRVEKENPFGGKKNVWVIVGSILLLMITIILCRSNGYLSLSDFVRNEVFISSSSSLLRQHIAFQAIVQLLFLVTFLVIVWKLKNKPHQLYAVTILLTIDLVCAAQLNAPYTIYSQQVSAKTAQQSIDGLPLGFPKQKELNFLDVARSPNLAQPFWQNLAIFRKQIAIEGFNSFSLTNFERLEAEAPVLFQSLYQNKLLVFYDSVAPFTTFATISRDSNVVKTTLFVPKKEYVKLKQNQLKKDTSAYAELMSYDASTFLIEAKTQQQQLLTLHQKFYHGWTAKIDYKKTEILQGNGNFMTVLVPKGEHKIRFFYENKPVKWGFVWSLGLTSILLVFFAVDYFKRSSRPSTNAPL